MKTFLFASVFFGLIFMQTVCEAKNKLKNITETYKGDGVASYLKRPGFFASDGVWVDFEKFPLMQGFDKELSIRNLPPVKHNRYALYFSANKRLEKDIAENIFIDISLKDEKGNIVGCINSQLESWYTGSERRNYFYLGSNDGEWSGDFVPDGSMSYTLRIHCWSNDGQREMADIEGHFFLRAGGYK
jgi:hypothetical protein